MASKQSSKTSKIGSVLAAVEAAVNPVQEAFAKLNAKKASAAKAAGEALQTVKAAAKPAPKAAPKPKAAKAKAGVVPVASPKGNGKAKADKAELIEGALRILRAATQEGSIKQIRKPASGKVKALPGRKSPTTRDYVAAIAGVGAHAAFQAIQVVKADPKLAQQVIAGKLALGEAFAKTL
jgi:hypothetical protein